MLKIRRDLIEKEKHSYSLDELVLPTDGIDCGEGCNPYGFPKQIVSVIENFDYNRLSLYPHCQNAYDGILTAWKDFVTLNKNNVMLVDGSDFVMYNINAVFSEPGAKVLGFAPQYTDYVANVIMSGMEYVPYQLTTSNNFKLDLEIIEKMLTSEYSILYIDNPNNPTGQTFALKDIEILVAKCKKLGVCAVIDEAYGDFISKEESAVNLVLKYDNLVVMRSISKGLGLAGLRAGFAVGSELLIECMQKVTNPYVVSEMTREIMQVALTCENQLDIHTKAFAVAKQSIRDSIGKNLHMTHTDDRVPICLMYHDNTKMNLLQEFFKHEVLTVPGNEFVGLAKNYIRFRIPKAEDMPRVLQAMQSINDIE